MTYLTPRVMFAAVLVTGAAFLVMLISGLTGMIVDSNGAPAAKPSPAHSAEARQLEALRDLFAYCRQGANWQTAPCATATPAPGVGTVYATQRVPSQHSSDNSDTTVIVRNSAPSPARTTTAPKPKSTPTKRVTPPPSSGGQPDITGTVEDTTKQVQDTAEKATDAARKLTDVTASAIAGSE